MLFINIAGIALIALIVWWFWLYKPAERQVEEGVLVITVENGTYSPSRIKISKGKPTELTLPSNKLKPIQIPALETGEYDFHCQMQMYRGKIVVG